MWQKTCFLQSKRAEVKSWQENNMCLVFDVKSSALLLVTVPTQLNGSSHLQHALRLCEEDMEKINIPQTGGCLVWVTHSFSGLFILKRIWCFFCLIPVLILCLDTDEAFLEFKVFLPSDHKFHITFSTLSCDSFPLILPSGPCLAPRKELYALSEW